MKGALAVPTRPTSPSARMPAKIATRLFRIVIALNIPPSTELVSSSINWLNSATSQLSKTLQSKVPQTPPSTRPKNRMRMSSASRVKLENEYSTQYARHAVRRPYRSANVPAKDAEIPAETNPMRNRNATVSSERPFSSANSESRFESTEAFERTFVNGVDIRSLEPVGSVDQQVYWEKAPFQFAQTFPIRLFSPSVLNFFWVGSVYIFCSARSVGL
jgi:hypothetical protein